MMKSAESVGITWWARGDLNPRPRRYEGASPSRMHWFSWLSKNSYRPFYALFNIFLTHYAPWGAFIIMAEIVCPVPRKQPKTLRSNYDKI